MASLLKAIAMLAAVVVMSGCGLQPYVRQIDRSDYPYRFAGFDYRYAWNVARTEQGIVIDGIMKNVRYPYVGSVELTVFVQGKDEKIIARETTFPMPQQTREGDVCHFSLLLKGIKPVPGDRFQFLVHYRGSEGRDEDIDWISSFTADALTGAIIHPAGGTTAAG
ncbi:MAG: hypothetical protein M0T70_16325 [Geobacteraceae bacterium]|nr:hypothetical protein [Geobacteraceae bacterium]